MKQKPRKNNFKKVNKRLSHYTPIHWEKENDMIQCIVKFTIFGLSGFFGIGAFTNSVLNNDLLAGIAGIFGGIIAILLLFQLEKKISKKATH